MGSLLILLIGLFIYFLPTIIGWYKSNIGAIFALNLLLGWSIVGWVVALVWAMTKDVPKPVFVVPQAAAVASPSIDQYARLKKLRDEGILTQEEFMEQVAKLA